LHERDTTCFVSLCLIEGTGVRTALPGETGSAQLEPVLAAMAALRTDRVFYTGGVVALTCDAAPETPLTVTVSDIGPFARGGIAGCSGFLPPCTVNLSANAPAAILLDSATAPQGCIDLTVTAQMGGATLTRHLGT